ncbi:hypothetical protein MBLNU230_g7137t1 [Neophaeotheca triangularis]
MISRTLVTTTSRVIMLLSLAMLGHAVLSAATAWESEGQSLAHRHSNTTSTFLTAKDSFTTRSYPAPSTTTTPLLSTSTYSHFINPADTAISLTTPVPITADAPSRVIVMQKNRPITTVEITMDVVPQPAFTNAVRVLSIIYAFVCKEPNWDPISECKNYQMFDLDGERCLNLKAIGNSTVKSMGPDQGLTCWAYPADVTNCNGPRLGNRTHAVAEFVFPGDSDLYKSGTETTWGSFMCTRDPLLSAAEFHSDAD